MRPAWPSSVATAAAADGRARRADRQARRRPGRRRRAAVARPSEGRTRGRPARPGRADGGRARRTWSRIRIRRVRGGRGTAVDLDPADAPHARAADVDLALRYLPRSASSSRSTCPTTSWRRRSRQPRWADTALVVIVPAGTAVPNGLPPTRRHPRDRRRGRVGRGCSRRSLRGCARPGRSAARRLRGARGVGECRVGDAPRSRACPRPRGDTGGGRPTAARSAPGRPVGRR